MLFFSNSSDRVLYFGWPDAGRDGLPGFLAALEEWLEALSILLGYLRGEAKRRL